MAEFSGTSCSARLRVVEWNAQGRRIRRKTTKIFGDADMESRLRTPSQPIKETNSEGQEWKEW